LHNKPQGCGASVASAAGPFTTKKENLMEIWQEISQTKAHSIVSRSQPFPLYTKT
jgi:hypothetical protein